MSLQEYLLYEARHHKQIAKQVAGVAMESDLHRMILDECWRRGWLALHGSMSMRTHRTVGEPDFVILADGGKVYFIEAKTKAGKLSPEQASLHAWANKLGHKVSVVRSMQEFYEAIETT